MTWLFAVIVTVVLLFGFVVMFGAPYLPTLRKQQQAALDLLDLKPGQLLVELGSGDGRMLKVAAEQGIRSVGYELNPLLVLYSRLVTFRYRRLVTIKLANFWRSPLPECDGIYVFLLDRYMAKLHTKIIQEIGSSVNPAVDLSHPPKADNHLPKRQIERAHYGVKLVSFAFKIPGEKHITEKSGMYLYFFDNEKVKSKVSQVHKVKKS